MTCPKCKEKMVKEGPFTYTCMSGIVTYYVWRCTGCDYSFSLS